MNPAKFFTEEQKQSITSAIKAAERNSSGEIRVHLERKCKTGVLDRAAFLFEQLQMHKTESRNGVLFYLAVDDHKFAILGDAGINAVTPDDFWDDIKEKMLARFREGDFCSGLCKGIEMAGMALGEYFPWQEDDINELPDDISYGDE